MTVDTRPWSPRRRALASGLLGIVFASIAVTLFWNYSPVNSYTVAHGDMPYFVIHDHVTNLLTYGDGAHFLNLLTGRPVPDPGYRWHRPLPLVLVWLVGLGNPRWIPYAFILVSIAGCGLLAFATAEWLGERWFLGPLAVLLPGSLASLHWLGPEALGVGLAMLGWKRDNPWLLMLAGLQRESLLLFSLHRRRIRPIIACGGWFVIVMAGFGGRVLAEGLTNFKPFGLFQTPDVGLLVLTVVMAVFAVWDRKTRGLAILFTLFMLVLGPAAESGRDFGRYLLPLWVLGFIAIVAIPGAKEPASSSIAST